MTVDEVKKTLAEHGLLEFVEAECRRRNVPIDWVLGRERYASVARVRHEIWFAIRETLDFSYPHIARVFGVDHSTVRDAHLRLFAERRLAQKMKQHDEETLQ